MDDTIFVGGGDGKVRKLNIGSGKWALTHEAQLDSRIMSISVAQDKKEILVGSAGGKLYRMLTGDLSFMLHTDSHTGCINDIVFG
jgi:WD40 repeat protein